MATLDDVRAILESNDDASHKLDRLAALLYPPPVETPAVSEPAPFVAPKPRAREVKPEPDPDAA